MTTSIYAGGYYSIKAFPSTPRFVVLVTPKRNALHLRDEEGRRAIFYADFMDQLRPVYICADTFEEAIRKQVTSV